MAENKKCCCGGKMKENTENEKKPVSADYARGTVGEGEKQTESWTCKFCGMSNTGAFCSGCGSPR